MRVCLYDRDHIMSRIISFVLLLCFLLGSVVFVTSSNGNIDEQGDKSQRSLPMNHRVKIVPDRSGPPKKAIPEVATTKAVAGVGVQPPPQVAAAKTPVINFENKPFFINKPAATIIKTANVGDNTTYPLCEPLIHNRKEGYKLQTLKNYRNEMAPLIFWHVQKAGGTSFCRMARSFYVTSGRRIRVDNQNCNSDYYKIVTQNISMWNSTLQPMGYRFFSFEPSDADFIRFPARYHTDPATLTLLNSTYGGVNHENAWSKMVHAIALRHPLDLSLSAFNYKFPEMNNSITGSCRDHNLSMDDCMQECFKVMENPTPYALFTNHSIFSVNQIHRIRSEVLGNYTIAHLSLTNNLAGAKQILSKFSLIVDLTYNSMATTLITCTLGWFTVQKTLRSGANEKFPTVDIIDTLSLKTYLQLQTYLKYEILLYNHAMHLSQAHYDVAVREVLFPHQRI